MNNEIANLENIKVVLVSVNKSFNNMLNKKYPNGRKELLDCVQKYWPVKPERANEADFVLGVYKNEIKVVAKIVKPWKRVSSYLSQGFFKDDEELKENPDLINRCAFIGELVENSPYLGKNLSSEDSLHFLFKYKNC